MRPRSVGAGRRAGRLPRWVAATALAACGAPVTAQDQPSPCLAVHVGTLHPVAGPAIQDATVLIRAGRIVAVGATSEIELPADAVEVDYPLAHAYPGLVDARSTAFVDQQLLRDGSLDAGVPIGAALDPFDEESRKVVAGGVTTAYVSGRAESVWRGQGALIRPRADGFERLDDRDGMAVQMRLTTGAGVSHPLQRQEQLARAGAEFEQLADYEKAFEDHAEKLKEYEQKFAEYLEWHEKHGGAAAKTEKEGEQKPDENPARARGRGGRRGRPGGQENGERPPPPEPKQEPAPEGQKQPAEGDKQPKEGAPKEGEKKPEDKAPDRPQYPKPPQRDPAKDALIEVRDGARPLFVEAQRTDEIRRALEIAAVQSRARIVLEDATGAAPLAAEIAAAGIPVILTELSAPLDSPYVPKHVVDRDVVAALVDAGGTIAIGSGSNPRARQLSLLAAAAVGAGIDPEVAIRAITLTPAEILGIADEVGSLEPGKRADLVLTTGPLLASESRVVRVIAGGDTVFEEQR